MRSSIFMMFLIAAFALVGCTASAPDDGVCKRTCGNRPIGGGKIRGLALNPKVTFSKCNPGQVLPQQTFRFLIYDDTSKGSSTTTPTDNSTSVPTRIPKAGISFTPVYPGSGTLDTPTNQWCTDSCGIAELQFTPTCFAQDVGVGVIVPGMVFDDGSTGIPTTQFSVVLE